jgi:hypothetical protein
LFELSLEPPLQVSHLPLHLGLELSSQSVDPLLKRGDSGEQILPLETHPTNLRRTALLNQRALLEQLDPVHDLLAAPAVLLLADLLRSRPLLKVSRAITALAQVVHRGVALQTARASLGLRLELELGVPGRHAG